MNIQSIGISGSSPAEIFRKHGLTPFREILTPTLFSSLWEKPVRASTVLVPQVVFWLMTLVVLNPEGVMATAVTGFWAPLFAIFPHLAGKTVTEEAFCTARKLLPVRFFRLVFLEVVSRYRRNFGQRYQWHDLNVWGMDGTKVDLPNAPSIRARYEPPRNKHGARKEPQALLVGLVGLFNGICPDFVLVPSEKAEQWCARFLSRGLREGDLVLADKNFASYEIMFKVVQRGAQFLIRLPSNRYHKSRRIPVPTQNPNEWYVDLELPAALLKRCPHLPNTMRVRILRYQISGFRPSLLITSLLDTQAYPFEEIVSLYHQRWNHETIYREWKHTLQISNLRSKSKEGIIKEILVQLTLNNLIRWIMTEAAGPQQNPVNLQFLESKRLIYNMLSPMTVMPISWLPGFYQRILQEIAKLEIVKRPGRSYPRKSDKPRDKGGGIIVQPARLPEKEKAA